MTKPVSKWSRSTHANNVVTGIYTIKTERFTSVAMYTADSKSSDSEHWSCLYTPQSRDHRTHQPKRLGETFASEEHARACFTAYAHYKHHWREGIMQRLNSAGAKPKTGGAS